MFDDIYFLLKASKICFGVAIAFLILAVIIFIMFDIKTVLLIETGRAQRRTILEMNERNQRTGKLRDDTDGSTGGQTKANTTKFKTGGKKSRTGEQKRTTEKMQDPEPGSSRGWSAGSDTAGFAGSAISSGSNPVPSYQAAEGAPQTALLKESLQWSKVTFNIIQKTIITHTDENIPA